MPTADRPEFVAEAIWYFGQQTYQNRELLILDNGKVFAVVPESASIRHCRTRPASIGTLRNLACVAARGEIMCHWDDDDLYHQDRIARQVETMRTTGKQVVGFNRMRFVRIDNPKELWEYPGAEDMAIGVSLCYTKAFWERHRFDEQVKVNEERAFFMAAAREKQLHVSDAGNLIVATIHPGNSSPRQLEHPKWRKVA